MTLPDGSGALFFGLHADAVGAAVTALEYALDDRAAAQRRAAAAFQRVSEMSVERMSRSYEEIYIRLLAPDIVLAK